MAYIENPKTKGSGIICCIPQSGRCPHKCLDCFFQNGRSYLEPLEENLPNMPTLEQAEGRIVRVNDGHDSGIDKHQVMAMTIQYTDKFYNTIIPRGLENFPSWNREDPCTVCPVVLTVNPGSLTDRGFNKLETIPQNLMFVRIRTNTWNLVVVDEAVRYYTQRGVPVVLTFMAYFDQAIPEKLQDGYIWRRRTLNHYWAITTRAWNKIMMEYRYDPLVYSCGKIEGEQGVTGCKFCGNCLREYYATKERLKKGGI